MKRIRFIALFAALLVAGLSPSPGSAQAGVEEAREAEIALTDAALYELRAEITEGSPGDIRDIEMRARELLHASRARLDPVLRDLKIAQDALDQLGPPPAEGAPPESEPVALRRAELTGQVSMLQGQRTRIEANIAAAGALLADISAQRLALLYAGFFDRGPSLLSPALWGAALGEAGAVGDRVVQAVAAWSDARRRQGGVAAPLALLGTAFLLSFLMLGPAHGWMRRRFTRRLESLEPTPTRRVTVAGVKMLARLATGLIGGLAVLESARFVGLLGPEGLPVAQALWFSLVAFLIVEGFASGLFAPNAPSWSIAAVDSRKARRASALLLLLVAAFGAKMVLVAVAETVRGPSSSFTTLLEGLSAVAVGALLYLLCRRRLWAEEPATPSSPAPDAAADHPQETGRWVFIRRLGQIIGILTIIAAVAGFVRLADFSASRLYFLALILALAWFLRAALRELAAWGETRLRKGAGKEGEGGFLQFWFGAGIDIALLLALAPALLVLAGLSWRTVRDIVSQAFTGFRIGGVTISVSEVFIALLVFFLILGATRIAQRGLERGVFSHSRVDPGVQNSLTTLLGYVGLLIALAVGITALGFDLSNLALIAGALSVGIGFGLQSIVNNFVSGLILLFERPVKVGDWIITQSGEGTVKRIGVRSTDIETFDRSSIIVPNSELVTQTVTNWTHKDRIGRITVPVGVTYGADAEKVREILLKCAEDHPLVVRYPEAFVVFQAFGDSSLDFELRCFLRDISTGLGVRTDLRFAILKAFREQGIEIPFPQRDVHVKSWPDGAPRPPRPEGDARKAAPTPKNEPEIAEDD